MCFKLHPDRIKVEGGSSQYSKLKDVNQGASDATTPEHSNTTVDVVLCVIEMNEEEENYKDGEFDSSNKVVELKFEEELFGDEDVIEIFNKDSIVEQEEESEYVLPTGLLSFPSSTKLLLTGLVLWPYIYGHFLGSIFYRGVSPSKNGLSAPSLERTQLRSTARVFLYT
jgi:hypothetical protein